MVAFSGNLVEVEIIHSYLVLNHLNIRNWSELFPHVSNAYIIVYLLFSEGTPSVVTSLIPPTTSTPSNPIQASTGNGEDCGPLGRPSPST